MKRRRVDEDAGLAGPALLSFRGLGARSNQKRGPQFICLVLVNSSPGLKGVLDTPGLKIVHNRRLS